MSAPAIAPLRLTLACGLVVEVSPVYGDADEIKVVICHAPGSFAVFAMGRASEMRPATDCSHDRGWSFWIGRTSIELDNTQQLQQVRDWIDTYRAQLDRTERVALEVQP